MKLVHPNLENQIIFNENEVNVVVLENHRQYTTFIQELWKQVNGQEGFFVLSEKEKKLDIGKSVDLVVDLFSLEINQKKIITRLYNHLKSYMLENEYVQTIEIISKLKQYLEKLSDCLQFPLMYNDDIDLLELFKAGEVKLDVSEATLLEKLIDYISVLQEFSDVRCLSLINVKSYFDDEELALLYRHVQYCKMPIMLIEPAMREVVLKNEKIHLIDKDLCQIL